MSIKQKPFNRRWHNDTPVPSQANTFHENLPGIAGEIHPFSVLDNSRNDSESQDERSSLTGYKTALLIAPKVHLACNPMKLGFSASNHLRTIHSWVLPIGVDCGRLQAFDFSGTDRHERQRPDSEKW